LAAEDVSLARKIGSLLRTKNPPDAGERVKTYAGILDI
jgi:hypothetical protein